MGKSLLLITSTYPYGKGEAYIETEIKYLAQTFNRIIIITEGDDDTPMRTVPENVKVHTYWPDEPAPRKSFFKSYSKLAKPDMKKFGEWELVKNGTLRRRLGGAILTGKELSNAIVDIMNVEQVNPANTVCYSYHMNDWAIGLAMLKDDYPEMKIVARAHRGNVDFSEDEDGYLPLRKYILEQLDEVYFTAEDSLKYIIDKTGIEANPKMKVHRLGVDNPYRPNAHGRATPLRLVSCSSLTARKRVPLIIDALSILTKERIDWTHIGNGVNDTQHEQYANRSLKGRDNIRFRFMGDMTNQEVLKFYSENHFDAFIHVSESETVPVAAMEAMAFGLPVLATNAGSTGVLVDDSNGYLMRKDPTINEITLYLRALIRLSDDKYLEKRKGAYNTWRSKFQASQNYVNFVEELAR